MGQETETPKHFQLTNAMRAQGSTVGTLVMEISHDLGSREPSPDRQTLHSYREKERIAVEHSEATDTLSVMVREEQGMTTVYRARTRETTNPSYLRPGRWTDYLNVLAERAAEKRAERRDALTKERATNFDMFYAPVDDAHLFEDEESQPK